MKRFAGLVLGVCVASLAMAQDSLWEITSEMEMPGMPPEMKGMKIPGMGSPNKQTMCVSEDRKYDTKDQKDCTITEQSQSGKITRIALKCKEGSMKIEREEISKDHWRAKMEMVSSTLGISTITG